jgi:RND superfamily putative drug exporter
LWLAAVAVILTAAATAGGSFTDNASLPGTDAQRGFDLLAASAPGAGGASGQVVFHTPSASVADDRAVVEECIASLRTIPHVLAVSDPFRTQDEASAGPRPGSIGPLPSVSADGRTAYATVHTDLASDGLGAEFLRRLESALAPARRTGVQVELGGTLGHLARPHPSDRRSELLGLAAAVVVLLVGFGSVLGAVLPIITATVTVGAAIGILDLLTRVWTLPDAAPSLATMMGLGVGVDYALFLLTRHRRELADGSDVLTGVGRTMATSGRAVTAAALVVVVAVCGLLAAGNSLLAKLGLCAAVAVTTAVAGALTAVPAALGVLGDRIDRWVVRPAAAEIRVGTSAGPPGPADRQPRSQDGPWIGYATAVTRHPFRFLAGGLVVLAFLTVPLASMRLGHVTSGADPASYTDRRAYDLLAAGFGPGANGPLTVVASTPFPASSPPGRLLAERIARALASTPDVAATTPLWPTGDGRLLVGTVVPASDPRDEATAVLLRHLNADVLPSTVSTTPGSDGARVYLTGVTAAQLSFRDLLARRLPLVIATVVVTAFIVLLLIFRGVLVAVKAAVLNLLSVGAAYGVLVAVFQWGWGARFLGVGGPQPIESYVPTVMFVIIFGLSIDYEIFLLSRVREEWLTTGANQQAVVIGLAATGRVITCGALIMTGVFLSFLLSSAVVIKMLALGLAASVLIDASIVRLVLAPAAMVLAGRANWWSPRGLGRPLARLSTTPDPQAP